MNLRGKVIPAVPVPFKSNGQIDHPAQQAYARWMTNQQPGGVAIWAHTGRGLLLNDDQRAAVLNDWREGLPGIPVICGVGVPRKSRLPSSPAARTAAAVRHTVKLAEEAKQGGASAVMVHPPGMLAAMRGAEQRILDLHEAVAETGLPVIAFYLYEAAGGIDYSPELVRRLLALKGVIGIKLATLDSVMSFQDVSAAVRENPAALLITGEDRFLGYSLMLGAHAALIGMAAACTDVMVQLLNAWFGNELARFVQLSAMVDEFGGVTFSQPMEGYIQRMLWALEAEGVIPGEGRDPFGPRLAKGVRGRVVRAVGALRGR
jgi:4-hydroxy-tetrahydrodipicolinate synthase